MMPGLYFERKIVYLIDWRKGRKEQQKIKWAEGTTCAQTQRHKIRG